MPDKQLSRRHFLAASGIGLVGTTLRVADPGEPARVLKARDIAEHFVSRAPWLKDRKTVFRKHLRAPFCGVEKRSSRLVHIQEIAGSNPASATKAGVAQWQSDVLIRLIWWFNSTPQYQVP